MSVDQIAKGFTEFYYNAFDTNRAGLAPLYRDMSMLTYEDKQFTGVQNIVGHLAALPFQRIKHVITKCDAQPSHPTNGSILITVMGQLQFDDSPAPMNFVQTFHLYPEGGGNYFVFNDIFRLVLH
ncbi:nuclear transport factor 2 [Rhizoclosmatium globosum]|uniref:Nuclear transport factor 2 n=1 Tax=Rhizoclosmatium globosum TaxID=329046 RepID=A0A1Y2C0B8_9FUNG|nr:Nuclear transport factor 2 [Rhizoclosmatium sp. JEL0117]ORY40478.1 nuclear transport factor 2 [Rhizoclosmatium globosum]|eukprot:ORY40478.1 nuclear transport factor 2 [Rhizoclosmatium globosum]